MFDKVGLDVQIFRHGKFKSAIEPFILDKMSPENKEQVATPALVHLLHTKMKKNQKNQMPLIEKQELEELPVFKGDEFWPVKLPLSRASNLAWSPASK